MLHEVFEKWTHARVQVPVAQRMAATLKWGGKSSRGPGSVAEIFVRTILGKTITVAIGGMLTTDDLLKKIGVKVNLSSSGHGIEPVLNFAGCEVQAGRLLSDYNIQNHSIFQQTWRLHGGMEVDGSTSQPRAEDIDAQMRARADGWATVRDPLSNFTIDITKQCVNVSLSRDGGTAVGPPHPSITARPACRSKGSPSSRIRPALVTVPLTPPGMRPGRLRCAGETVDASERQRRKWAATTARANHGTGGLRQEHADQAVRAPPRD